MRIDVVGQAGAGKTTLAEAISKKLSIPHIHLDRFWFEADIRNLPKGSPERVAKEEKMRLQVEALVSQENWVSDGAYFWMQSFIASKADHIVLLDIPLWRRVLNHAQRMMHPEKRHKETGFLMDLAFFWEIIKRTYTKKHKFERFISEYKDKIITLRSYKAVDEYLTNLS